MALITFGIKKFLISRKQYLACQILEILFILMAFAGNMKFHTDVISTRTPNPDKALPYFIAVFHFLILGGALMIAFHWYL